MDKYKKRSNLISLLKALRAVIKAEVALGIASLDEDPEGCRITPTYERAKATEAWKELETLFINFKE